MIRARKACWLLATIVSACGHPSTAPVSTPSATPAASAITPDATEANQDEKLAAIQKAMNELDEAARGCWGVAAVDRFDIEGELAAQIEIGKTSAQTTILRDTAHTPKLSACLVQLLDQYHWAPPLHGQTIQLPFKFRAPDGQSVIDRRFVPFAGQGKVSVAVVLDEMN
ncbi:MAG: Cupin domain protein, partial [Myxococcales bacterium]|nr:Cupin domain protein [Myxococcales bacterium]